MERLRTGLNLGQADAVYAELIDAHRGLVPNDSERLNARLVLLLANHVGDAEVVREAIRAARAGLDPAPAGTDRPPPLDTRLVDP